MHKPVMKVEYVSDASRALYESAARAVKKLSANEALDDVELLGVVMVAQPELITFRQLHEGNQETEYVELSTQVPVEAVLTREGINLRRLA